MRRLLLVVMVGAIAGCGGSGSGDDRDGFVQRVDALCRQANPELVEINTALVRARDAARSGRAGARETFATFARLLRRAGAVTGRLVTRLREIEPPARERDFHRALIAAVDEGASNLRRQIDAAERRDAGALRELSRRGSVANARSKGLIAGHGGFRDCGRA
ncbi:MAG TPA: hypothetical protein VF712_05160 [Thermoleophilaceae bacterium]